MIKSKNLFRLFFSLLVITFFHNVQAEPPPGQVLQINTDFSSIQGKPSWILIIRDLQNGQVIPYIFDLSSNQNYWLAFTYGRSYRITSSQMKFGENKVINNFCGLESGILSGVSMTIYLHGKLTPNSKTSECHVSRYNS